VRTCAPRTQPQQLDTGCHGKRKAGTGVVELWVDGMRSRVWMVDEPDYPKRRLQAAPAFLQRAHTRRVFARRPASNHRAFSLAGPVGALARSDVADSFCFPLKLRIVLQARRSFTSW
jgi:hypothetical protein